jgi:integrase
MKFTDQATRPHVAPPVFANIPRELQDLAQWVLWQFVWNGKEWAKVPYNARTIRPAKTNDASTWASFDAARTTFEKRKNRFYGFGFVFTAEDEFCGIDFDNCAHGEQITNPLVTEWLEKLESYTEQSVSGSGFHTIVKGVCGGGLKNGNFEIYDRGRYFTVSGRGVYHYQFQSRGVTYCGTLPNATTDAEARAQEADEKAKVRLGLRPEQIIDDSFSRFVDDVYLKYSKENKESHAHDEFRCKVLVDYFTSKGLNRFRDITTLAVVGYIKHRLATKIKRHNQKSPATHSRSPVTVHKETTLLSSIFNMAIQEKVATDNPCRAIPRAVRKMIRARSKRRCAMTPEKEALLINQGLAGRYAHLRPVCLFDLHTGLRLSEATRLEREHINLENESKWFEINGESCEVPKECFIVIRSKTDRPRVIPLNSQARKVAVHQLNDATVSRFVFPSSKTDGQIKGVKKGLAGACKQAGIKYGLAVQDGITFIPFAIGSALSWRTLALARRSAAIFSAMSRET